MMEDLFSWDSEKEIGFYPVKDTWYNDLYFEASIRNSESSIAKKLNEFRARIVNKYINGKVLDFGAGCGAFLNYRKNSVGFDICPKAIDMLKKKNLYFDFYRNNLDENKIDGITFFDVLEHIKNPEVILSFITSQHIFVSLPIFRDKNHVLMSKHFKIQEHFWYFTDHSLIDFVQSCGFELIEKTNEETRIGREDIWTYVFRRSTCESCFWHDVPRLPADKIKYGDDGNGICGNIESKKDCIESGELACKYFVNNQMRWDDGKKKFVHIDKWESLNET